MGAARIITLRGQEGIWDGYVLELRRLLDGTLGVRIFQPGQRTDLSLPGGCNLAAFAGALAKSAELKLSIHGTRYTFQRDHDWVRVNHVDDETNQQMDWMAPTAEVLDALSELAKKAA